MPENDELKKYLDYDGLAYLLQRFPKTTVHCTFDDEFAGETATLSHGTTTYTKTVPATSPYELTFAVNELGTWTLNCSYLGTQYSDTVDITYLGQKGEIELTIVPDGSTAEPVNSIPIWLKCANLDKSYTTLAEVLADTETYETLLADSNACQYMKRSTGWAGMSNLVPKMTSNTTPEGTVSYSSQFSGYPWWWAFDGNIAAEHDGMISGTSGYVAYTFTSSKKITKVSFYNRTGVGGIKDFTVDYLDTDGTTWRTVYSGSATQESSKVKQEFVFDNDVSSNTWRISILNGHGATNAIGLNGLQFHLAGVTTSQDAMARLGKFDYAANKVLESSVWKEAIWNSDYRDYVMASQMPVMTSNTTPKGVASASSEYSSNLVFNFFNDNTNPWVGNTQINPNAWISGWAQYMFDQPVYLDYLKINIGIGGLRNTVVQYSNDGTTWTDICEVNTIDPIVYKIENRVQAKYIRLYIEQQCLTSWADRYPRANYLIAYGRASEEVLVPLVPTMTSDTTPSGTCIRSSVYSSGYEAFKAFDNNTSTWWNANGGAGEWIGYTFTRPVVANKLYLYALSTSKVGTIKVQASNDGFISDIHDISSDFTPSSFPYNLILENNTAYSSYRIINISGTTDFNVYELQFYQRTVQTNIIHSTPNDTIYMLEDGDPIVLATTNSDGDGILDFSQLSAGPVTLYSSVAKDLEHPTVDYHKTITITKTQYGGTTEAYLRPSTIGMLYWYGYSDPMVGLLEAVSSSAGWNFWNNPFNNPTWTTNYINITTTNTANQVCGVGNKAVVDSTKYNKFHLVLNKVQGSSGAQSNVTKVISNSSTAPLHSYDISQPASGISHYEFDYERDLYILIYSFRPNVSGAVVGINYLYAWWYTNESE